MPQRRPGRFGVLSCPANHSRVADLAFFLVIQTHGECNWRNASGEVFLDNIAIGLPLMVADAVRLKLWDAGQGDIPVLVVGVLIALVGLGLACLAVYGVVRAIGWVIGDFAA